MKPTLLVASLLALAAPVLQAASDFYLKIDGIKGESSDDVHRGEIEVASWSWGETNTGTTTAGGAGSGKVSMQDFHFVVSHDKSSPLLMLACAQGNHIPSAVLTVRRTTATGAQEEYLTITLEDVLVTSYASSSARPTPGMPGGPEQALSLNFTKISFSAKAADGSVSKFGWDVKAGSKI